MSRRDAMIALQALAAESGYFSEDRAVVCQSARGVLDVLGALNAQSGGTLAQMALPGCVAVSAQSIGEPVLRVRSAPLTAPTGPGGGETLTLALAPVRGQSERQVAEHLATLAGTPAGWAAGLLALWWQLSGADSPGPLRGGGGGMALLIHSELAPGAGQGRTTALLAAAARAIWDLVWPSGENPAALAVAQWVALARTLMDGPGALAAAWPGHVIHAQTSQQNSPPGTLLRYSAQPHRLVGPVPMPRGVRIMALDTGVHERYVSRTIEELRVAAAMGMRLIETIYRDLGQRHTPLHGYLANTSPLLYRQYFRALLPRRMRGSDFVRTYGSLAADPGWGALHAPGTSGGDVRYPVRTAVDHLIAEHEHAEQFVQAMEELADAEQGFAKMEEVERQRTLQRAGRLLLASHYSYRLRLRLSCPQADWLVERLMEAGPERGIYGARITGRGGGGTVAVLLARSDEATDALLGAIGAYRKATDLSLGVAEA